MVITASRPGRRRLAVGVATLCLMGSLTVGPASASTLRSDVAIPGGSGQVLIALPGYAFSLNPQIAALAQQFNQDHPNQPPVTLTLSPSSGNSLSTTLFLLQAKQHKSSYAAWFGITPFINFPQLVSANVIQPWGSYLPASIRAQIYPSVLKESSYNGQVYSWPQIVSIVGLGWRTDMLHSPPATWSQMLADAKAAESKSKGAVFGDVMDLAPWRSLLPLSVDLGGASVFQPNGYLDLTSPAVNQALTLMKELYKYSTPQILDNDGDVDAFRSGRSAMMIKYIDAQLTAAQSFGLQNLGFGPLPSPSAGAPVRTVGWSTGFALFRYATPQQKQIATNFITYLTNSSVYEDGWLTGGEPTVYSNWYHTFITTKGIPSWVQENYAMRSELVPIPPTLNFIPWAQDMQVQVEAALEGKVSVTQALATAQKEVASLET
jgi:multiple sugar transport system substrate-binding protein